jgi:hypothetical protein
MDLIYGCPLVLEKLCMIVGCHTIYGQSRAPCCGEVDAHSAAAHAEQEHGGGGVTLEGLNGACTCTLRHAARDGPANIQSSDKVETQLMYSIIGW